MSSETPAPFQIRINIGTGGLIATLYRRETDPKDGEVKPMRVCTINALAYTAGKPLVRDAITAGKALWIVRRKWAAVAESPRVGQAYSICSDWGPRIGCFGLVAAGLKDGDRLSYATSYFSRMDSAEAAWWFGMLLVDRSDRAVRALRILSGAVE